MKTPKEISDLIVNQYCIENTNNRISLNNSYSIFYSDKYFTKNQQNEFYLITSFSIIEFLKSKRNELITNQNSHDIIHKYQLEKEIYYCELIFKYCSTFAPEQYSEDEIIMFLDYYDFEYMLTVYNEYEKKNEDVCINTLLMSPFPILQLVSKYIHTNSMSSAIEKKLKRINNKSKVGDYHVDTVTDILNGKIRIIEEEKTESRHIFSNDISSNKRWKWLQENKLEFINKREDFYFILEKLSFIDYFNSNNLSEDIIQILSQINSQKYEEFVLDLYREVTTSGKKRSGWFIGEKVIAFQIITWILYYLETENRFSIFIKLAEKSFTKIPRVGPTSRKLGDLVLKILYYSESIEGVGSLLSMKSRCKNPIFKEELDKAIERAANYANLNINDIEDYFINDFGLIDGEISIKFGDYLSKITIDDYKTVNIKWFTQLGKPQKSVPAKVRTDFKAELKIWKSKQSDIRKELSGQKQRFEEFFRKNKKWEYIKWKKYILKNELLKFISTKLIWAFRIGKEIKTGYFLNGKIINFDGLEINGIEKSIVTLWHPIQSTSQTINSWQKFILSKEIVQPFKQAFREIYFATEEEINSPNFSERFSGHILKHHNLVALAKQRLWTYPSIYEVEYPFINYNDFNTKAILELKDRYELAVVSKIQFKDIVNDKILSLNEINKTIFSETMRDVDLFISICTIGIEENWKDEKYFRYWNEYSNLNLSEIAKTRRTIIKNLISKFDIASKCDFSDKFLIIHGKLDTYKIHFGSGNVLMKSNNQFLSLQIDDKKKAKNIYLPFENELILSLILSKAFLLANDNMITNEKILNQIKKNEV